MGMGGGTIGIGGEIIRIEGRTMRKKRRMARTIAGLGRARPHETMIETNHGEQLIYMGTREGAYRFVGRKKGLDSAVIMEVQPNDMQFTRGELDIKRYIGEQYNPEDSEEGREFTYTTLDSILHGAQL